MNEIADQDIPIIRFVLGDRKFDASGGVERFYTDGPAHESPGVTEYLVELPENLAHGFPDRWNFTIIRVKGARDEKVRGPLLKRITEIIDHHTPLKGVPVLFISTTEEFQVQDELPYKRMNIFGLTVDDEELAASRTEANIPPHQIPLISSMRKSLTTEAWQEFWVSPYRRSVPADGWRFFGRQKELRKITESMDNYVVVGARRIGKTSLLQELMRLFKKQGFTVYRVDTQDSKTEQDLVNKLVEELDPRVAASLTRRQEVVTTTMLEHVLRQVSKQGNSVLLIDEIGNLMARGSADAWKVMGTLRSHAHNDKIKLVCTASQTYLLRQQNDYEGPWVNFANTLILRGLTREEAHDFVLKPIRIWRPLTKEEGEELFELIYNNVGSHPMLLTAYCEAFFARVVGQEAKIMHAAQSLLKGKDEGITRAINEVFHKIPRPLIQYLFLQHCLENHAAKKNLMHSVIAESWINETLKKAGYKSTMATRLFLLDALNTRALTEPDPERQDHCRVIAPIVFKHSRLFMPLEEKRDALREEIALDADEYSLVRA